MTTYSCEYGCKDSAQPSGSHKLSTFKVKIKNQAKLFFDWIKASLNHSAYADRQTSSSLHHHNMMIQIILLLQKHAFGELNSYLLTFFTYGLISTWNSATIFTKIQKYLPHRNPHQTELDHATCRFVSIPIKWERFVSAYIYDCLSWRLTLKQNPCDSIKLASRILSCEKITTSQQRFD